MLWKYHANASSFIFADWAKHIHYPKWIKSDKVFGTNSDGCEGLVSRHQVEGDTDLEECLSTCASTLHCAVANFDSNHNYATSGGTRECMLMECNTKYPVPANQPHSNGWAGYQPLAGGAGLCLTSPRLPLLLCWSLLSAQRQVKVHWCWRSWYMPGIVLQHWLLCLLYFQ